MMLPTVLNLYLAGCDEITFNQRFDAWQENSIRYLGDGIGVDVVL